MRVVLSSATALPAELVALVQAEPVTGTVLNRQLTSPEDPISLRNRLRAAAADAAVAVITGPLAAAPARLLLLDVDSTLTTTEAIDLLAAHAGRADEVAVVTGRAMRGELDFAASLRQRVATLGGLPESVFAEVQPEITLSPGAEELIERAHAAGAVVGVTSGGFTQLVAPLAESLGLDFHSANLLEVIDGTLTGRVVGPVVDRARKAADLRRFAAAHDVPLELSIAVGDGANDLDMLAAAGLGIAYCAKPVTAERADVAINVPDLRLVADFANWR